MFVSAASHGERPTDTSTEVPLWHGRRSSGVSEYSTVSTSANSLVDFDGLSEATLAAAAVPR